MLGGLRGGSDRVWVVQCSVSDFVSSLGNSVLFEDSGSGAGLTYRNIPGPVVCHGSLLSLPYSGELLFGLYEGSTSSSSADRRGFAV